MARWLILLVSLARLVNAQSAPVKLEDVRRIYVASLGRGEGADVIRSKVINYLVWSRRREVVEKEEDADAVLTGASQVTESAYYSATTERAQGGTSFHATAGVRLIGKNSRILWVDDTSNGWLAWSATSSLAERISKDLIKAVFNGRR